MIRKALLVEAQTAPAKRSMFCGMQASVPLLKFCETRYPTQYFAEIGQSAAELWPKAIFNMVAVCYLQNRQTLCYVHLMA